MARSRMRWAEPEHVDGLLPDLRELARPLSSEADLDPLLDRIGEARHVLLGEASHGTSEFYRLRACITRRLVREKGFSFVAVEGDWPDCHRINRFVKGGGGESAEAVLGRFDRWPTWMWANREVQSLVEWLRAHNRGRSEAEQVGFYGLDVYSLWQSMDAVVRYLERVDPKAARAARRSYECFAPFEKDEQEYARATVLVPDICVEAVVRTLAALQRKASEYEERDRDAFFDAEQNALTARNAELYYRTMVDGGAASWNVRDRHMVETLERLMTLHGPQAKCIVWEHNTHVGDARATVMAEAGEINVGQLVREAHQDTVIVGFTTHRGSVIAGEEWGAPMQRMKVPSARDGSWDDAFHRAIGRDGLFLFEGVRSPALLEPRGQRAIGVVYRPAFEWFGNYVPSVLPRRYDAVIHCEETRALSPLHPVEGHAGDIPETFPSGM